MNYEDLGVQYKTLTLPMSDAPVELPDIAQTREFVGSVVHTLHLEKKMSTQLNLLMRTRTENMSVDPMLIL